MLLEKYKQIKSNFDQCTRPVAIFSKIVGLLLGNTFDSGEQVHLHNIIDHNFIYSQYGKWVAQNTFSFHGQEGSAKIIEKY